MEKSYPPCKVSNEKTRQEVFFLSESCVCMSQTFPVYRYLASQ